MSAPLPAASLLEVISGSSEFSLYCVRSSRLCCRISASILTSVKCCTNSQFSSQSNTNQQVAAQDAVNQSKSALQPTNLSRNKRVDPHICLLLGVLLFVGLKQHFDLPCNCNNAPGQPTTFSRGIENLAGNASGSQTGGSSGFEQRWIPMLTLTLQIETEHANS